MMSEPTYDTMSNMVSSAPTAHSLSQRNVHLNQDAMSSRSPHNDNNVNPALSGQSLMEDPPPYNAHHGNNVFHGATHPQAHYYNHNYDDEQFEYTNGKAYVAQGGSPYQRSAPTLYRIWTKCCHEQSIGSFVVSSCSLIVNLAIATVFLVWLANHGYHITVLQNDMIDAQRTTEALHKCPIRCQTSTNVTVLGNFAVKETATVGTLVVGAEAVGEGKSKRVKFQSNVGVAIRALGDIWMAPSSDVLMSEPNATLPMRLGQRTLQHAQFIQVLRVDHETALRTIDEQARALQAVRDLLSAAEEDRNALRANLESLRTTFNLLGDRFDALRVHVTEEDSQRLRWRNEWDEHTVYNVNDVVSLHQLIDGSASNWIAKATSINLTPTEGFYWARFGS